MITGYSLMDQRRTSGTNHCREMSGDAGIAELGYLAGHEKTGTIPVEDRPAWVGTGRYGFCTRKTVIKQTIHKRANGLATYAFRRIFERVDKAAVKRGVDEMGLKAFITHRARLAAP